MQRHKRHQFSAPIRAEQATAVSLSRAVVSQLKGETVQLSEHLSGSVPLEAVATRGAGPVKAMSEEGSDGE